MSEQELRQLYFDWLYQLVVDDRYYRPYRKLLGVLFETEFTYLIPMDANRAEDGINLRYRFGRENSIPDPAIACVIDIRACSVLEMMVALAIRCEEDIMLDSEAGNRTGQWFWGMIASLGLGVMDDLHYQWKYVYDTIERFLNRQYAPNGRGGLFTLQHCDRDLRTVDIWYQMMWYLSETVSA